MMMKKLYPAVLAFGLLFYSTSSMATTQGMMGMFGMSEAGMYNLTIGGLAGGDDAKGIDEKFRAMAGVEKVHVDFDNGMIMVWVNKDKMLDRGLAEKIVRQAGFTLDNFEAPK